MPRPTPNTEEIDNRIVDALYPEILLWLKCSGESNPESDEEGVKRDLLRALDHGFDDDSYRLLKNLESLCYWSVDSSLGDVMDRVPDLRYKYHKEAVVKWVSLNEIKPLFEVGNAVQFKMNGKTVVGEILSVYAAEARYGVHCPSLGHVKEGMGTYASILNYEEVSAHDPSIQSA